MIRVYPNIAIGSMKYIMDSIDDVFTKKGKISGLDLRTIHKMFEDISPVTIWITKNNSFFCAPTGNGEFTIYVDDPELDREAEKNETEGGKINNPYLELTEISPEDTERIMRAINERFRYLGKVCGYNLHAIDSRFECIAKDAEFIDRAMDFSFAPYETDYDDEGTGIVTGIRSYSIFIRDPKMKGSEEFELDDMEKEILKMHLEATDVAPGLIMEKDESGKWKYKIPKEDKLAELKKENEDLKDKARKTDDIKTRYSEKDYYHLHFSKVEDCPLWHYCTYIRQRNMISNCCCDSIYR